MRRTFTLGVLFVVGLSCSPRYLDDGQIPGGACDGAGASRPCAYGFYCSQVEVCVRRCDADGTCQLPCDNDWECAASDRCVDGACQSTRGLVCLQDHCVPSCHADGGCGPDPYGPATRRREDRS